MEKPELKQFGDLTREDFDRHPLWIGSHTADYHEPGYDETDEETFRPWVGDLPADASDGMLLVKAIFELRNGERYPGFLTPSPDPDDLGTQQPHIFVGEQAFGFWGGLVGVSFEERQSLYSAVGRKPDEVFPMRFNADQTLASGNTSGQVAGFYWSEAADGGARIEL